MDLVIIEAPGKRERMEMLLRAAGHPARVVATGGHFFHNPKSLLPVAITENGEEPLRAPRPEVMERLRKNLEGISRIFIATDADSEGNVIAADLAGLLATDPRPCWRVIFTALDVDAVRVGMANPQPFDPASAHAGTLRRRLDRVLGAVCASAGLSAGRVAGALVGAFSTKEAAVGEVNLSLPAADGGAPFHCRLLLTDTQWSAWQACISQLEALNERPLPAVASDRHTRNTPYDFGRLVLASQRAGGFSQSIGAIGEDMQNLYERGLLSYPRSEATALGPNAAALFKAWARRNRVGFDPKQIPLQGPESGPHPAPHPLREALDRLDPRLPQEVLTPEDTILLTAGRQILRAGRNRPIEVPAPDALSRLPDWAQRLPWQRQAGSRHWLDEPPVPGLTRYPLDTIVFQHLLRFNLGRPSTLIQHTSNALNRQLITPEGRLSAKGETLLATLQATFPRLADPSYSRMVEKSLDQHAERLPAEQLGPALWKLLNAAGANCASAARRLMQETEPEAKTKRRWRIDESAPSAHLSQG